MYIDTHTFPYNLRWSAAEWRPCFPCFTYCVVVNPLFVSHYISRTVAEELQGQLETVSRDSSWSISSTSHPLVGQSSRPFLGWGVMALFIAKPQAFSLCNSMLCEMTETIFVQSIVSSRILKLAIYNS